MLRLYIPFFPRITCRSSLFRTYQPFNCSSIRLYCDYNFKNEFEIAEKGKASYLEPRKPSFISMDRNVTSVLWKQDTIGLQQLQSCVLAEDVLQFLNTTQNLTPEIYGDVFNMLFKLHKSGNSKISKEKLFRSPEVEELARRVTKDIRKMRVEDCVTILKTFVYFNVSFNSILGQHLLQYIGQKVNMLGILQVVFLSFVLRLGESSPLVEVLKNSAVIVFETNIRSQLEPKNPEFVHLTLNFALREKNVSDETRAMLVETALSIVDDFNEKQIHKILNALTFRHHKVPAIFNLYDALMYRYTQNLDSYDWTDLVDTVEKMIERYIRNNPDYFNEPFVKGLIEYFISKEFKTFQIGILLRQLNRVSYYSPELIDYMDGLFSSTDSFEEEKASIAVFAFISACSNCSHKPKNWSTYESKIVSFIENRQGSEIPLLRLLTDLICLKCWPTSLIEYCFSDQHTEKILRKDSFLDRLSFLNLYQITKVFYPGGYPGPWPSNELMDYILKDREENREYPLLESLQVVLGGPEYVLPGVKTHVPHFIDYLIVKRKSGQAHPINPNKVTTTSKIVVESLEIPEDSYLIAVMLLSPASFCLEGLRIRGKIQIILRSIESLGIIVVPISEIEWLNLADVEKIPYLKDRINTSVPMFSEDVLEI